MDTTALRTFVVCILMVVSYGRSSGSLIDLSGGDSSQLTLRGSDFVTQVQFAPTDPVPESGTESLVGTGATAAVDYNYTDGGISLSNLQFSLNPGAFAEVATTYRIVPTVDLQYSITGSMHWSGGFGSPTLFVQIQDITLGDPGPILTNQFFSESGTNNANLAVVASGPNPLTGLLTAGHSYKLSFDLANDTSATNNTPGTASGAAAITWVAVPEPSSLMLLGFSLVIAFSNAWRTRKRKTKCI